VDTPSCRLLMEPASIRIWKVTQDKEYKLKLCTLMGCCIEVQVVACHLALGGKHCPHSYFDSLEEPMQILDLRSEFSDNKNRTT
jgi:hypothetical protein